MEERIIGVEGHIPTVRIDVYGDITCLWINGINVVRGVNKITFEVDSERKPKLSVGNLDIRNLEKAISASAGTEADVNKN